MANEKLTTIVLNDVFLARRGKGKGVQQTKCFGIPVYEKDAPIGTAAIDINIEPILDSFQTQAIVDAVESLSGLSNRLINTGIINGINEVLRSETTQAKSEFNALIEYIKQEELHRDDADADKLAKAFQSNQRMFREGAAKEQTLQEWTDMRRGWIETQKEKGLWRATLNKTPETSNDAKSTDSPSTEQK